MIFFQGGGGNPFDAFLDSITILIQGGGVGGSALGVSPADPFDFSILFLILTVSLFEKRKVFFMVYALLSYVAFGIEGAVVGLVFWILFYPVQMAFDFFTNRRL